MAQRSGPSSEEGKAGSRPHAPSPAAAASHGGVPKEGSPGPSSFEAEGGGRASDEKAEEDTDETAGGREEEGGGAGDRDRDESEDESAPLLRGPAFSSPAVPVGAGSIQGYRYAG